MPSIPSLLCQLPFRTLDLLIKHLSSEPVSKSNYFI
jgi:hypothetical protein